MFLISYQVAHFEDRQLSLRYEKTDQSCLARIGRNA